MLTGAVANQRVEVIAKRIAKVVEGGSLRG